MTEPRIEKILSTETMFDAMNGDARWNIPIHEHGFVALVDVMPRRIPVGKTGDYAIVQAARVSYSNGTKAPSEDRDLIRYLLRNYHTTPFEMCLAGDTEIPIMPCEGATNKSYTIKELADTLEKGGRDSAWVRLIKIRTVNKDGTLDATFVKDVRKTGTRKVYKITEDSPFARTIKVTDNHPILTPNGYKTLKNLKVGDEVLQNGTAVLGKADLLDMWNSGMLLKEIARELQMSKVGVFRLLRNSGIDTKRRKGFVRKDDRTVNAGRKQAIALTPKGLCQVCNRSHGRDVHHVDKNPKNNAKENRIRVCSACHKALDGNCLQKKTYTRKIKSIEFVGVEDVYDLEVMSDNHNFVANGFVVHNCEFKFHCKMPIFIARQWIRHRTANVNEESARYSVIKDEFYTPDETAIRQQSKTNKQGGEIPVDAEVAADFMKVCEIINQDGYSVYETALEKGIARELARINLPLSTYTSWYWKIDLHNLFHFLRLRMDKHAQQEIRDYANAIFALIQPIVPLACEAFVDYRLEAMTLSRLEVEALRDMKPLASENKRELAEFIAKHKRLNPLLAR